MDGTGEGAFLEGGRLKSREVPNEGSVMVILGAVAWVLPTSDSGAFEAIASMEALRGGSTGAVFPRTGSGALGLAVFETATFGRTRPPATGTTNADLVATRCSHSPASQSSRRTG